MNQRDLYWLYNEASEEEFINYLAETPGPIPTLDASPGSIWDADGKRGGAR